MCAGCHLGPGVERSGLSQGLYPQAPELAKHSHLGPAEQFWIIKHGVKLSAMPAWGKTHPDPLIWDMVAFVRRLPGMSAAEYQRRSEEHTSELQSLMRTSYAVFCLKKNITIKNPSPDAPTTHKTSVTHHCT